MTGGVDQAALLKRRSKSTSRLVDRPAERPRYQKVAVFFTPEQRSWLKGYPLPEGLSASDIVRLAVNRLRAQVTNDAELIKLLTEQAYEEVDVIPARKQRGMPK